jgi:hypothetical protein
VILPSSASLSSHNCGSSAHSTRSGFLRWFSLPPHRCPPIIVSPLLTARVLVFSGTGLTTSPDKLNTPYTPWKEWHLLPAWDIKEPLFNLDYHWHWKIMWVSYARLNILSMFIIRLKRIPILYASCQIIVFYSETHSTTKIFHYIATEQRWLEPILNQQSIPCPKSLFPFSSFIQYFM